MPDSRKKDTMSGAQKAAVLLVSIDPDAAARVLAQLDKDTVEHLSVEIARLEDVAREERDRIIEDFYHTAMAQQYVEQGGVPYARQLLERVLPPEEVTRIIETIEMSMKSSPFHFLQRADPAVLLTFLQDEHEQTIALILAYMGKNKAAEVLQGLPAKKQLEVVKRLSAIQHTSPESLAQVEHALERKLAAIVSEERHEAGGVKSVAEILNLADRATERSILETLEEEDPDLVDQIRRLMFVFEDIILVNDRGLQAVLREIDNDVLARSLKSATPELKEKFFKNMSKRAVDVIKEEMEFMGPIRLSDVESAQQKIVDIVRRLEEQGQVIIQGRGGVEEIIV
ncbi:MAG: flagellar motor switch protein FliG [Planctomycetota bacterium]|nr:flagellar motor switch protein FliG [Planctomycetota bacterium]